MHDLKRRMAAGAAWLVLFKITERSIGIVSTLILARVLIPEDFGLVAMATSILASLDLLGAFSFDMALIQNQHAARHHYDTAWTFAVIFGGLKAGALCALAFPAAYFFREARLPPLVFALAAYTLIEGFDNVGIVAFQKDLELHKEFRLGLVKKLVGFVVTVSLAFWLRSYWALMAGILSARLTSSLLSYAMHPFRPKFSLAGAGDLFSFSKWLLLNNFLIFVNNRGTDFVIGKLAGARALGLYSVSYEIANLPTTELVWPISRAVFPGYAKMANDPPRLREAFLQVISLVAIFTVPAGVIIALAAEPIVQVLLGAKWSDAVPLIQVLAVFGIVRSLHGPTGSIYLALGKPRFVAGFQCIQLSAAIGLMFVLVPLYGTIGAAYALLVGASLAMIGNYFFTLRELHLPVTELMRALWRPGVGAAAMVTAVRAIGPLWAGDNGTMANVLRLGVLLIIPVVVYLFVVLLCWWIARRPEGPESQIVRLGVSRLGLRTGS